MTTVALKVAQWIGVATSLHSLAESYIVEDCSEPQIRQKVHCMSLMQGDRSPAPLLVESCNACG